MGHSNSTSRHQTLCGATPKKTKDDMVLFLHHQSETRLSNCSFAAPQTAELKRKSTSLLTNQTNALEIEKVTAMPRLSLSPSRMVRPKKLDPAFYASPCNSSYYGSSRDLSLGSNISMRSIDKLEISKEEYKWLRLTGEVVKINAQTIGLNGMKRIFEQINDSKFSFKKATMTLEDLWEIMGQGIMILYELNKCIELSRHSRKLRKHVAMIVKRHRKYGVSTNNLHQALYIFHELMVDSIRTKEADFFNHEDIYLAWTKFFKQLHGAVENV